ncbi:MAG: hypothetical protein KDD59_11035, partial [Bdellovibrionales bacterium]|nr:hypothetical protein [Bdellovibrionales bacterium]
GLHSQASFELGVGTTSVTSGRLVPSLAVANYGASWGVSGFATGVQTATYYQSAYGLNILSIWSSGDFFGGPVQSGFGLGLYYAVSAYQDSLSSTEETAADFTLGPAFRVQWLFLDPLYFNLEATFGLRSPTAILQLSAQDVVSFALGWRLW